MVAPRRLHPTGARLNPMPNPRPLRDFVQAATLAVTPNPPEADLLATVGSHLATLVSRDDWLPDELAQPHPQFYRQCLPHADLLERSKSSASSGTQFQRSNSSQRCLTPAPNRLEICSPGAAAIQTVEATDGHDEGQQAGRERREEMGQGEAVGCLVGRVVVTRQLAVYLGEQTKK